MSGPDAGEADLGFEVRTLPVDGEEILVRTLIEVGQRRERVCLHTAMAEAVDGVIDGCGDADLLAVLEAHGDRDLSEPGLDLSSWRTALRGLAYNALHGAVADAVEEDPVEDVDRIDDPVYPEPDDLDPPDQEWDPGERVREAMAAAMEDHDGE